LIRINECLLEDEKEMYLIGKEFYHRFRKELITLSEQLSDSFDLWATYFQLSRSRYHQLFNDGIFYNKKLSKIELLKQDPYLAELNQAIHRLKNQHQDGINQILKDFINQLVQGNRPSRFLPYGKADHKHLILVSISTIYYATIQLLKETITLGTTIHNIVQLETTNQFRRY
jgi:hypothetical protein